VHDYACRGAAATAAMFLVIAATAETGMAQNRTISISEVARVGPPDREFARISDVAADGAGGVWVADGMAGELYLHRNGTTRRIAGPGQGPGELTPGVVELVLLPGDSVLVIEPHARRWSLFAPSGAFVETITLEGLNALARVWRLGADGMVLARVHEQTMLLPGAPSPSEGDPIVAFDRSGRRVATLARLPLSETFRMGAGGMPAITMLAAEPIWDADASGRLLLANTAAYAVDLRAPGVPPATLIRGDAQGAAVPRPVEAKARELLRETLAGRRMPPQLMDQFVASATVAPRLPVLGAVLAGPNKTVWMLDGARTGDELVDLEFPGGRSWRVYDHAGRPIGAAIAPTGFRAFGFNGRLLSGMILDEFGGTTALVLRVEP
jgi:hypothetical protein